MAGANSTMQSAAGTRLNRRGRETRQRLLDIAIVCLAEGSGEPLSANRVAREAGVSWGTLKHQFGDLDGLWAAVLVELTDRSGANSPESWPVFSGSIRDRVWEMVDAIWTILGTPEGRAVETLRAGLPNEQAERLSLFPRTAAAMAEYENAWLRAFEYSLADLALDADKVDRIRCLIPPAIRGINNERRVTPAADVASALQGLVDAITAYLR
ncbi:TetR/AcrR family transcriptional regulator [Nocardia pseudobrasiliensis]|uniref:TetR family transcriptional regulator n=1 Tax=Nocardia pseudobrasiliensis TaxID=45979 RepID=A0A370HXW9_9NOCA|nr:TetR/AcrR family transcriptional regulator [Nocardia pseudobrasiliensis]RDI63353.1 TetR family transcriptional regulator [Nocardia pseudobrasiliensis]